MLKLLMVVRFCHLVRPESLNHIQRVGHGKHIVCIGLTQLFDKFDNSRQIVCKCSHFFLCNFQTSEMCDVIHLVATQ